MYSSKSNIDSSASYFALFLNSVQVVSPLSQLL